MSIEVVEVGDNDRNRKCYSEHAGDDAHGADQLAPDTDWRDVTVPDRRHGNDCPPERARNRRQLFTRKQTNCLACVTTMDNCLNPTIVANTDQTASVWDG